MRTATMLLAAVMVLVATPACTDFEAGEEANKQGDYATELKKWRPLAEQGDADAQTNLGLMYRFGRGVPQDDKEAVRWYRLAAEQGYALAQAKMGLMYDEGLGVPEDDKEAVRWYRLAAEQGFASAQNNLGQMYADGRGVTQDDVQAHMWVNLAGVEGDEGYRKQRDILAEKMTPVQLAEARRLTREWKPKGK